MLSRVKILINNVPLGHKISGIIVIVSLTFVGLLSFVGLQIVMSENDKMLYSTMASSLEYSATALSGNLNTAERISAALLTDSNVQDALVAAKENSESLIVRAEAFRQLNNQMQAYQTQFISGDINFMTITASGMTVSTNTARMNRISDETLNSLEKQAKAQEGRAVWKIENNTLLLSRAARQVKPFTLTHLGVLTIGFDLESIIERCTNFEGNFDKAFYALSQNGQVIYKPSNIDESLLSKAINVGEKEYKVIKNGEERYFVVGGKIQDLKWQYNSIISYDSIYHASQISLMWYAVVMVIGLVLAFFMCSITMRRVTKHIDNLIYKMRVFGENSTQRVDVGCDYSTRGDELGVLHRRFDNMADRIEQLIQIDYTNKILMKDAQLKALETQIDPHFLYNVLASVNWRAKAIGEVQISKMVEALSKLLRATLDNSTDSFTLEKEIELVESYAIIQQLRFEDQLDIKFDIPTSLKNASLPKLTIQPLLENAIRCAMEQSTDICLITVKASLHNSILKISVTNTDSQFEDDFLTKLKENKIEIKGFGIGILNIEQRLKLTFGDEYGLEFCNENNCARVIINIPYKPIN